jgi:hypothetical protein
LFYMEAEGDLFKNRGDDERDEEDDIKAWGGWGVNYKLTWLIDNFQLQLKFNSLFWHSYNFFNFRLEMGTTFNFSPLKNGPTST